MTSRTLALATLCAFACAPVGPAQCGPQWQQGYTAPGVAGTVYDSALWDPDGAGPLPTCVIVGGHFAVAGGVQVRNLAVWDPVRHVWSGCGGGTNGPVHALAVLPNGDLIVGGRYGNVGGVLVNRIGALSASNGLRLVIGAF